MNYELISNALNGDRLDIFFEPQDRDNEYDVILQFAAGLNMSISEFRQILTTNIEIDWERVEKLAVLL